jgi:hypothetical protein
VPTFDPNESDRHLLQNAPVLIFDSHMSADTILLTCELASLVLVYLQQTMFGETEQPWEDGSRGFVLGNHGSAGDRGMGGF